ncbi:hypothetical protein FHX36_003943 [Modestobacter versicolor]|uniref:Uncharacterized protein n=1 Tax=Modestobacter versicolor TaxID=429133 RepID=A0A839Y4T1_9ACTN|nr:hypothetical protein [Modestobacter versicolor]MBB3678208.1 hypothetical protein [Modestobacter versicolor]
MYVIDVDDPSRNTPLGCRTVTTQMALPLASWDETRVQMPHTTISGWAFDPDRPGEAVQVHVYLDTGTAALWTGDLRPDVHAAHPAAGDSAGWSLTAYLESGLHRACVWSSTRTTRGGTPHWAAGTSRWG